MAALKQFAGRTMDGEVWLVEDRPLMRCALAGLIRQCPALTLAAEFSGWEDVLAQARRNAPAAPPVVVVGGALAGALQQGAAHQLAASVPMATVVCHGGRERVVHWPAGWEIRRIGDRAQPREFFRACGVACTEAGRAAQVREGELSAREHEVYRATAEGVPLKQIAVMLGVSMTSAHTYRRRAMAKLGLANTVELVRHAAAIGLTPCPCGRSRPTCV